MLGFPTHKDLLRKLDFISGTINTVEGIAKQIRTIQRDLHSPLIRDTFELLKKQSDKSSFFFSTVRIDNLIIKGRIEKITMNEFQFIDATFEATKRNGQPAKVQNPRVETDNSTVLVGEITGENSARFTAQEGSVSEATSVLCKVIADADLGDGIREIEVVGSVVVTPGEAEILTLSFGEAQDKPTA